MAILCAALAVAALATPAGAAASEGRRAPLIASASACPNQTDPSARPAAQVKAMRCLLNSARAGRGLPPLAPSAPLNGAAGHKSADILRCDEFSHEACGREFTYWVERSGYRGRCLAENIAWGSGPLGSVRSIFSNWMRSSGHRENILGPYAEIGIGLRIGGLEGYGGAHVWTQVFGGDCS
ncbi:MAG TPA: CAP domain-containing protein [Solirubrobacterales bacterium]|nr:CAP domain-containing protein [Solirubrobacterales bacterium]